ncbi:MAG: hypothetical protein AB7G15_14550 [Alphaproteobacteria bacterium]
MGAIGGGSVGGAMVIATAETFCSADRPCDRCDVVVFGLSGAAPSFFPEAPPLRPTTDPATGVGRIRQ